MDKEIQVAETRRAAHRTIEQLAHLAASRNVTEPTRVMLYGYGQAAAEGLFLTLARTDLLPLEFYIVGHPTPTREHIEHARLRWQQQSGVVVNPQIAIHTLSPHEAIDYIASIDFCTVTADRATTRTADRIKTCRENLPIADDIAKLVRASQHTHFDIVTNLGELLAYKIFADTDCDPYRLSSNGHLDKMRLDAFLINHFAGLGLNVTRTDAFAVGTHQNPWPVVNNMQIDTGNGYVPLRKNLSSLQRVLQKHILGAAAEQIKLRDAAQRSESATAREIGASITHGIHAFIHGGELVNAGVFMDGKYVLAPTYFTKDGARPSGELLSRMTPTDRYELAQRKKMIDGWLDELGIRRDRKRVMYMPANIQNIPASKPPSRVGKYTAGLSMIALVCYGLSGSSTYEPHKQQRESAESTRTVGRPSFDFSSLQLSEVKHVRYVPEHDRGLFVAHAENFKTEKHDDVQCSEVLVVFYNTEPHRVEVVLAAQSMTDPQWIDNDTFQVTCVRAKGLSLEGLPDNSSNPKTYIVDVTADNHIKSFKEK